MFINQMDAIFEGDLHGGENSDRGIGSDLTHQGSGSEHEAGYGEGKGSRKERSADSMSARAVPDPLLSLMGSYKCPGPS